MVLALVLTPAAVLAHSGGTPQLTNEPAGPYRVYAWSDPEPWRAGEVHLTLAVTVPNEDAGNEPGAQAEVPVTDANILVTYTPVDGETAPLTAAATRQTVLNDFYYEAVTELPAAGLWMIDIAIEGPQGNGSTELRLEAFPARTINWLLVGSAGGVLLILIALIGVWSRIQQPDSSPQKQRPGSRRRAQTG